MARTVVSRQQQGAGQPMESAQQVAALAPSRLPIAPQLAKEFDVSATQWRVLVDQIFPSAKSIEAVAMALEYCRVRHLDIFKKPVHIVPMWSTALGRMVETVWPGISEIRTTAARTGAYAGIDAVEFGADMEVEFSGEVDEWDRGQKSGTKRISKTVTFPEWASVTVYRLVGGVRCPFNAIVYWEEAYATIGRTEVPNDMWEKRPRGQVAKCVEAAALRMAFPEEVGNMLAAEEMEGRVVEAGGALVPATPARPTPPIPPPPPEKKAELHISDQQEGQKNEVGSAQVEEKPATADNSAHADTSDVGRFLADINAALELCTTADAVEKAFDELDVQIELADDEDAVAKAFAIKTQHLDRVKRIENAVDEDEVDMFPGDKP